MKASILTSAIAIASATSLQAESPLHLKFEDSADAPKWVAENDGVMGGLSTGSAEIHDGKLIFAGKLSLENNGGFAQIQTVSGEWDLSSADGVAIRVKGDGRTYQFRMSTTATYRGSAISYAAEFETEKDSWTEVFVKFDDLEPTWRGKDLDGPALDLKKVTRLAFLLADKNPGEFRVVFDTVEAVSRPQN